MKRVLPLLVALLLARGGALAEDAGPPAVEGDLARKVEIMHSERWHRAIYEFGRWFATQKIYTHDEVNQIKLDFNDRVARMTSFELEYLLDDLDAKLAILATPEAQDAKAWMGEYLAAMSDRNRAREVQKITDRASMTAAELQQEIDRIERTRVSLQQRQQAFEGRRQDLVDAASVSRQQTADAAAAAYLSRGQAAPYSPYRGSDTVGEPPFSDVQRQSGVGMVIGPFGPYITFGLGGGF
jgi:hypothetical protein